MSPSDPPFPGALHLCMLSVVRTDYARFLVLLLVAVQDTAPIVVAFSQALPDVLNASVGELNFKNVISKLGDVMYTFPFSLPPYYIAIIRCLGVLEGVAIQVGVIEEYPCWPVETPSVGGIAGTWMSLHASAASRRSLVRPGGVS